MASFNRIILAGNLTRDPEFKEVGTSSVCKFGFATNRKVKDNNEVMFIDVECWGSVAELCNKYLKKGRNVLVEGRLTQQDWVDKATGANRSKHSIVASAVQFLDSGDRGEISQEPSAEPYDAGLPF